MTIQQVGVCLARSWPGFDSWHQDGLLSQPGGSPDPKARSHPWVPLGMAQTQQKVKLYVPVLPHQAKGWHQTSSQWGQGNNGKGRPSSNSLYNLQPPRGQDGTIPVNLIPVHCVHLSVSNLAVPKASHLLCPQTSPLWLLHRTLASGVGYTALCPVYCCSPLSADTQILAHSTSGLQWLILPCASVGMLFVTVWFWFLG